MNNLKAIDLRQDAGVQAPVNPVWEMTGGRTTLNQVLRNP